MSANNAKTALAYCRIWHEVDASQKILGRLAGQIARVLMGKHKPIYQPAGKETKSMSMSMSMSMSKRNCGSSVPISELM